MTWFGRLFRRSKAENDLDRELAYHVERRIAELTSQGMEPHQATRQARLEFGTSDVIKEACRDARGTRWLEDFLHDCRYGMRILRRSPIFTAVAVLSLALGIGANTAIFTMTDRLMLRTLPVHEPQRLVEIGECCLSYPLFEAIRHDISGLDGALAEFPMGPLDIFIEGRAEVADIELLSSSYYSVLGINANLGQTFTEDAAVAVISDRYWKRRFASDPQVIGKTFRRVDTLFTIIGVAPPQFTGIRVGADPDIAIPLAMDAQVRGGKSWRDDASTWWLGIVGRLRPGVSSLQILAELNTTLGKDRDISPLVLLSHFRWEVRSAATGLEGRRTFYREPLQILMAAVALILLMACTNLANLLLSKAASRHREIAVRLAVGAGRGRVMRQLLTEAFLISIPACAIGVLLAYGFSETLLTFLSNGGPRLLLDIMPDVRMLAFAVIVSITACVLFGLAPAILSTRLSLQPLLAETPGNRSRLGKALLVTQMAISVVLLIVGGIFVRTLVNLYQVDTGLNPSDVMLFSSNLTSLGYAGLGYSTGRVQQEETELLSELATVQGIQAVTLAKHPPISRGSWSQPLLVEGHDVDQIEPHLNSVAPDFFKTFRTPLLLGREFDNRDTDDAPRVVVVNEAFVRSVFSDGSPLGKWVAFPFQKETHYQIVGVVKDVRYENLRDEPPTTVYFAAAQVPPGDSTIFAVRSRTNMAAIAPAIQQVLTKVDPILRVQDMHTLQDHIARSVFQERMLAILAGFFGAVTVVLAAVGIYGVMAYSVSRRKREIGIRIALGANRVSVIRLVLGQTIALTLLGSTIGTLASLGLTHTAAGFLFGIRPNDPATIVSAIAILLGVAAAAAYLPGRTAARTNPVEALRLE